MAQSYYDNASNQYSDSLAIEIAILQNDIILPSFSHKKLSFNYLKSLESGTTDTDTANNGNSSSIGTKTSVSGGYVKFTDKYGAKGSFSTKDWNNINSAFNSNKNTINSHTYKELKDLASHYNGNDTNSLASMNSSTNDSDVYAQPWSEYTNVIGNFYIQTLFPLVENSEPTEMEHKSPSSDKVINGGIKGSDYVERNYISLMIPRYIALNWLGIIPKGTKFLAAMIGGSSSIDNISIIGIYGPSLATTAIDLSKEDGGIGGTVTNG